MMVQYRGINVSMISQHGCHKVPEYEPSVHCDPFCVDGPTPRSDKDSIASCYVPSYPGTQVWFDYSIETPHPPNAQYFFKLLCNGEVFTSWDCTAKHNYQGRTTYALKYLGTHPQTGQPVIERQAFNFSTNTTNHVRPFDDCIEVRVHRIEHRIRLPPEAANSRTEGVIAGKNIYHDGFRLVNGGILAQNDPKRHYKYQLLDPVDKPYATIRFYYRTKEFLTVNGIATSPSSHTRQPSTSSDSSHAMSDSSGVTSRAASKASSGQSPPGSVDSKCNGSSRAGTPPTDSVAAWLRHHRLQKYTTMLAPLGFERLVTLSDTDLARIGIAAQGARGKLLRELADYKQQHVNKVEEVESENAREKEKSAVNPTPTRAETCSPSSTGTSGSSKSEYIGCCIGSPGVNIPSYVLPSERAEHFGANTTPDPVMEDSIEKLTLPAPPFISISAPPDKTVFCIDSIPIDPPSKTLFSAPADKTTFSAEEINPIAPTTNSAELISPKKSPKKAPPKSLKVQINNVDFELEKEEKEPFSPFTSGGMLRHLLGPTPPSAPARITAFGPTIDDQLNAMREECRAETPPKQKFSFKRTTRAERCSGRLSKILGKAMGRA